MIAILLTIGCAIFWQPIVGFDQKSSSEELETITTKEYKFNRHVTDLRNKTMANLCFCSMGEHACDVDEHTCLKDSDAACFHSIKLEYNANQKQMEIVHHFGCAPFERGGNGSHLTCNAHRSPHARPYSIACCYEGNYCNRNIIPPNFSNFNVDQQYETDEILDRREIFIYFIIFMVIGFIILTIFYCVTRKWLTSYKRSKDELNLLEKKGDNFFLSSSSINSDSEGKCSEESSGAGYATLNQRTVAQYLTFLNEIASGRYGCVQQAYYRTRLVAVKTFYTKDEESWRNEKDIYLTQMLNHENILQFVAADICSVDSVTKMLLITDYHPFGSLYDYLKQRNHIYLDEALKLALTSVLGLEHLHTKVFGTSCKYKPEIAHRDIKSKNIIVKQPGICCLADFGLAVRIENGIIKPQISNPQAGTRRYMSPEVLSNTLNPINFDEFKKSDIYSLSLVFWEIFKRVRITEQFESIHRRNSSGSSTESGIAPSASSENSNPLDHCSTRLENMPLMSSSTDSGHCSDGNINTMPYELSYSGMVSSDPTIEEMRNLVCVERKRPPIPNDWSNNPGDSFCKLKVLMTEMWSSNPVSRHTALKVKMELDKIISALSPSKEHSTYSSKTQYSASSSGIGSAKQTNT